MLSLSTPLFISFFLFSILLLIFPLAIYFIISSKIFIIEWVFFSAQASPLSLNLIIDPFGLLFSCTVLFISANVMLFTHSYIAEDPFIKRFCHLVILFVLSINFLIYIPHLVALLLGWDGLGLTSFLLVIYYQNPKSLAAGIITALTNRIGDVLILLSIALALNSSHWNVIIFWHSFFSPALVIFLMVAAITKSAQIPFSSWLPAAIAAPTPVSALVHSSTLVTAGVFLLFRFYPFFSSSYYFHSILLVIAVLTTTIAGIRAITECDIKKIIALSTLSQLGVIMVSLAIGAPILAFFHIVTHALFKALLFLCAGSLIHLHHHSQDLRFIGNIPLQLPSITAPLLIANLALCGAPFLAGFYSKDIILEFSLFSSFNYIFILFFFFATGLTAAYTTRFLLSVLWSPSSSLPNHPISDTDIFCSAPTAFLSFGAITAGSALRWSIISPSIEFFLPFHLKILTIFVTILGFITSWIFASSLTSASRNLLSLKLTHYSLCLIWFLVPLASQNTIKLPLKVGHTSITSLDNGWEELIGGQGILRASSYVSSSSQSSISKYITHHLTIGLFLTPLILLSF